jgi:catechol 2,3-dioxygenase-like lactoylglutathione lyase family enzyme
MSPDEVITMSTSFSYDHVGLSVADLDTQRRFYAEAFGLQEENYVEIPQPRTRIAFLRSATGLGIELVERAGSTQYDVSNALEGARLQSYFHLALAVPDLDDAIATAVGAGGEMISPPAPAQRPGIRFAYLKDPEGNLIELVQSGDGCRGQGLERVGEVFSEALAAAAQPAHDGTDGDLGDLRDLLVGIARLAIRAQPALHRSAQLRRLAGRTGQDPAGCRQVRPQDADRWSRRTDRSRVAARERRVPQDSQSGLRLVGQGRGLRRRGADKPARPLSGHVGELVQPDALRSRRAVVADHSPVVVAMSK